jgi:hypothetical protein
MEKEKNEFYDRKTELTLLKNKYNQIDSTKKGVMIAIYGRRRVGKTELIKKFLKNIEELKLYFYVGLSERGVIFNNLTETIKEQTGEVVRIEKAEDFLDYLMTKSKNKKLTIVLDEFPRFLDVAPELITSLQNYWDNGLKDQKIMILLVGSSIGMMQKITDSKAGALYGRAQKLKISPFRYVDFRLMFQELSEEEKVLRYGVFGGTPYYLEKTKKFNNTQDAINNLILKKDSDLSEEPKTLLGYENVKIHAKYNSILQSISSGKEILKEIQDFTKMSVTNLPPYINKLDKLLDLVEKNDPILGKERLGRYKIKDNFFRFWYRFIFPNETAINLGNTRLVFNLIKENINSYIGRIFEDIVKELLILYNTKEIKGLKINFENIGSWWDRNNNEIDILAYNLKEKDFLIGEVKWTDEKVDSEVVESLYKKSKFINKGGNYHFIFVSKNGFTSNALKKMESLKAIYLDLKDVEDLFNKIS